jgi:hypothetical protein
MWGRVKELFRIPALAGMGAEKGKQVEDEFLPGLS